MRYNSARSLRHLGFGPGVGSGEAEGGGGGEEDVEGGAVVGVVLDGGAVWIRLGGGGGTFGTLSGGIVDVEDGVEGVEEEAGPGVGPVGTGGFTGACELADPGRKAGSELRIVCLVFSDGFGASAKDLCITNSELADSTRVTAQREILVPGHCIVNVIPPAETSESSPISLGAATFCLYTGPIAA